MFRLWFLIFFGEYRRRGATAAHGHCHGHGHGHGEIHESPRIMLVPLVILAVLSVGGGWAGVPGSLVGSKRFSKFLWQVVHTTQLVVYAWPTRSCGGFPPV